METESVLSSLDFHLEWVCCEVCDDQATQRVVFHTCNAELVCHRHADWFVQTVQREVTKKLGIECQGCKKPFWSIEEWAWIEPL